MKNGENKRRTEMMIDCVFDKEERQEGKNVFSYVRPKDNDGEKGRWRWISREYKASINGDVGC